jgi:hypothetical protein
VHRTSDGSANSTKPSYYLRNMAEINEEFASVVLENEGKRVVMLPSK